MVGKYALQLLVPWHVEALVSLKAPFPLKSCVVFSLKTFTYGLQVLGYTQWEINGRRCLLPLAGTGQKRY